MIRYSSYLLEIAAAVIGICSNAPLCRAQSERAAIFSGDQPLNDFARRLEARYAVPVTVEWPLTVWAAELRRPPLGGLLVSDHAFSIPESDGVFTAPQISLDLIARALDQFHRQNPGRSRYKVIQSAMGFHIVPTDFHDRTGTLRPVQDVLNTEVEVLEEERTFTLHVSAVLSSISSATHIRFTPMLGLTRHYLDTEYVADRPMVFKWGASEVSAREALIDLLMQSATTLTWEMRCGPTGERAEGLGCNLDLEPLAPGGVRVYLDRCTNCKPIAPNR